MRNLWALLSTENARLQDISNRISVPIRALVRRVKLWDPRQGGPLPFCLVLTLLGALPVLPAMQHPDMPLELKIALTCASLALVTGAIVCILDCWGKLRPRCLILQLRCTPIYPVYPADIYGNPKVIRDRVPQGRGCCFHTLS